MTSKISALPPGHQEQVAKLYRLRRRDSPLRRICASAAGQECSACWVGFDFLFAVGEEVLHLLQSSIRVLHGGGLTDGLGISQLLFWR